MTLISFGGNVAAFQGIAIPICMSQLPITLELGTIFRPSFVAG